MGIDSAPFWASLFLYSYQGEYTSSLISSDKVKARHFRSTKQFIDDLCSINDCGKFGKSFSGIYQTELELKDSFLNLDIIIKFGTIVYKLFNKRNTVQFSVVEMPHIDSKITQNIFYYAIKVEFLRVGC